MSQAAAAHRVADVPLQVLHNRLQESLGEATELYLPGTCWSRLDGSGAGGHWQPCDELVEGDLLDHLTGVLDRRREEVVQLDGGLHLLLPIKLEHGRQLAAAARFDGDADEELLLRLGRAVVREIGSAREVESLASQLTTDFEELSFMRHMARHLELLDVSVEPMELARHILPPLYHSIAAESLVFLPAMRNEEDEAEVGDMQICLGDSPLDEGACRSLVTAAREEARHAPLVSNNFPEHPRGGEFPALREVIVVSAVKGPRVFGWLLALNRLSDEDAKLDPWQLSHHEFGTHEATLMSSAASILATHATNVELFGEKECLLVGVVRSLVNAIEAKDRYTRGHSERVAQFRWPSPRRMRRRCT